MLRPVKPGQVKNALLNVLDRHGIAHDTAQSIWDDLTTGNDPMPAGVPAWFFFKGIQVAWPSGRHTRVLREDERKALNNALKHSTTGNRANLLDSEDSAEVARHAYVCLWNLTTQASYDATPIAHTAMDNLVKEATTIEFVTKPKRTRAMADVAERTIEFVSPLDDLTAQLDALAARLSS